MQLPGNNKCYQQKPGRQEECCCVFSALPDNWQTHKTDARMLCMREWSGQRTHFECCKKQCVKLGNWHRLRAAITVSEKTVTISHASQPCWSQPTWETEIHLSQGRGRGNPLAVPVHYMPYLLSKTGFVHCRTGC